MRLKLSDECARRLKQWFHSTNWTPPNHPSDERSWYRFFHQYFQDHGSEIDQDAMINYIMNHCYTDTIHPSKEIIAEWVKVMPEFLRYSAAIRDSHVY